MVAQKAMRGARLMSAFLASSVLMGCLNFAEYNEPSLDLPDGFAMLAPVPASTAETAQWWRLFNDPLMNTLVERVQAENLDLREAQERVTEAQAIARREGNTVSGSADLDVNLRDTIDTAGLGLSLVLDPFGGERSEATAALQRLEAAEFDLKDAELAVASEVMQAYVDLRFFQQSLVYRTQDLDSRRKSLSATRSLLQEGVATRLDEIRLEALVAETRADIPQLSADIKRQENRIATLLGTVPQSLDVNLRYAGTQPYPATITEIGVPADLLRRRPDIRAAERAYAAAVSEVNAAEAARFPSLTLSGDISAPLEGNLGSTRSTGIGLNLPVFNQPGLAAQVDANTSRAQQAYLQWQRLVLASVADVETALSAVGSTRRQVEAARTALRLNLEALELSQQLYTNDGTVTVIDLLGAERSVTAARTTVARAVRAYATEVIALYVALGVGFDVETAQQG
jgi:multidrug efflux system outer membrane protein